MSLDDKYEILKLAMITDCDHIKCCAVPVELLELFEIREYNDVELLKMHKYIVDCNYFRDSLCYFELTERVDKIGFNDTNRSLRISIAADLQRIKNYQRDYQSAAELKLKIVSATTLEELRHCHNSNFFVLADAVCHVLKI